jgi:hypothetical protein
MLVVVVEHESACAESGRGIEDGLKCRDGSELITEVIGHRGDVVTERFDLLGLLDPVVSIRGN